jgi:hypothetical protein
VTTRFCNFCGKPITDPIRLAHFAAFCTSECKQASDRERRTRSAEKKCRLCGRRYRIRPAMEAGACAAAAQEG